MRYPRRCHRAWAAAAAVAAVTVTVGGCSSSSSSTTATTPGVTSTATPSKSFTVNTPAGTVSVSLDGKLPSGWPSGFPLPSGSTAAGSGSLASSSSSSGAMVGVFHVSGSGSDAFDFYKNSTTLTVSDVSSVGVGPAFAGKLRFSGPYSGATTVTSVSSQTLLIVVLTS
jgi:hypothetical protein